MTDEKNQPNTTQGNNNIVLHEGTWCVEKKEKAVAAWALDLRYEDIPLDVLSETKRAILDTIGTALGAQHLKITQVVNRFISVSFPGNQANIWFSAKRSTTSALGAALANALITDGLDMHDTGHYTKGHAGAALVPCAFACLSLLRSEDSTTEVVSGKEFLTAMVAAYEIAYRAGQALHETSSEYHSSGAWNALGCSILCCRLLRLSVEDSIHALGIADYYGPRSQMMRVVNLPTMVKDGSGQGAFVGLQSALMAREGFTGQGCPIISNAKVSHLYDDLGDSWRLVKFHVYKKHAVCYWAQPSIAATIDLMKQHDIVPEDIESIRCHTFKEAANLSLQRRTTTEEGNEVFLHPTTSEEAQYSVAFPVAVAAFTGQVGPREVSEAALQDKKLQDLASRVTVVVDAEISTSSNNGGRDKECQATL